MGAHRLALVHYAHESFRQISITHEARIHTHLKAPLRQAIKAVLIFQPFAHTPVSMPPARRTEPQMQHLLASPTAILLLVGRLVNPCDLDANFTINSPQPSSDTAALKRVIQDNVFKLGVSVGNLRFLNPYFLFRHAHQHHGPFFGVSNPTLSCATGPWWKKLPPRITKVWKSLRENIKDLHRLYFLHMEPELAIELAEELLILFGEITLENLDTIPLPIVCPHVRVSPEMSSPKKRTRTTSPRKKKLPAMAESSEDENVRIIRLNSYLRC